jgi:hypothetical protein
MGVWALLGAATDLNRGASKIVSDGKFAQQMAIEAVEQLWKDIIAPNAPLWDALVKLSIFFALGTLALFMVQWAQEFINEDNPRSFSEIIWPLIVVVLLSNGGATLADGVLALRSIFHQLNTEILSSVGSGLELQEAYKAVHADATAETMARTTISRCSAEINPDKRAGCMQRAISEARSIADQLPGDDKNMFERFLSLNTLVELPGNAVSLLLRGWLFALGYAFQLTVEIVLLLTGLLAPLAVGGTLFPIGTKALLTWAVGFFSVAMVKICYNLVVGLVATLILNAGASEPLFFAFIVGLLAPILSMVLAAGGGISILRGLTSTGSVAVSWVSRRF